VSNLVSQKMNAEKHRLKRSQYDNIVIRYKQTFPWLTKEMLKQRVKRSFNRALREQPLEAPRIYNNNNNNNNNEQEQQPQPQATIIQHTHQSDSTTAESVNVCKGGRPLGSTKKHAVHVQQCINMAKVEICELYQQEMQVHKEFVHRSRTSNLVFKNIVERVKLNRKLPSHFTFSYSTAMDQIRNSTQLDQSGLPIGRLSPLRGIEETLIQFLIILGKIGSPVSKGQGIRLVNELIEGTVHQKRLIEYKKQKNFNPSNEELGQIGEKYWYRFLHKYEHRIVSKKGRRFELDRSKWTRYKNFKDMYENVEEEMISAGIAERLNTPIYMDAKGNCASNEKKEIE
jgi:hypothetical protein